MKTSPTSSNAPMTIMPHFDVGDDVEEPFAKQHCLYFFPLPQGQGSFLPTVLAIFAPLLRSPERLTPRTGPLAAEATGAPALGNVQRSWSAAWEDGRAPPARAAHPLEL